MAQALQNVQKQFLEDINNNSGLTIATGIILILMGMLAMGAPFVAGISVAIAVGVMLIIGGIGQLAFAFKTGKRLVVILLGALNIFIGGYMLGNPGAALATLTLFLAIYLIISGISEVVMSFHVRPAAGWVWALIGGIVSALLGIMIWRQFPFSGVWTVGLLVGIRMLFGGFTFLMVGIAARGAAKEILHQNNKADTGENNET